ncbi:MAG TPA: cytochrome c-type biogenesis protein CcmH [Anaerolineaceae bacterium]
MQSSQIVRIFILILLGVLFSLVRVKPVQAQQPLPTPSDNDVNRVARELYCPVCENIPLDVCPTQACREWRELIRLKQAEGWTDAQIKEYFARQYGPRVLSEPPLRGLNWLIYVIPPILFAGGIYLVYRVLTNMRRVNQPVKVEIPAEDTQDPFVRKIEEELRKQQ